MTLGPLSEIRETGEGRLKNKMCSSFCPEGLCKRHLSRGVNKAEGYWKHQRHRDVRDKPRSHRHAEVF